MDINNQRSTTATPAPASRAAASTNGKKLPFSGKSSNNNRLVKALVVLLVVAALGALVWFGWKSFGSTGFVDRDRYQAVFLTNGQVYFGKITSNSGDYLVLKDVFYLQASNSAAAQSDNPQDAAQDQASGDLQLIKLGTEVHGPDDEMIISRAQMLFFENLQEEGRVSQSIKEYNESQD